MHVDNEITTNALRYLGYETNDIIPKGTYGAVLARAGVGKTSFLVQVALNYMLREKRVLHISLEDPVEKIDLWYKEVFHNLSQHHKTGSVLDRYETILRYRLIMTLKKDGFSAKRLEDRLEDLAEQNVFSPDMTIIDGLPFDASSRSVLLDLKALTEKFPMSIWFSVKTHRHEAPGPDGLPNALQGLDDLFSTIFELHPEGTQIHVLGLKGGSPASDLPKLVMDPTTMIMMKH